jgi:class 3 adenylate cyclase
MTARPAGRDPGMRFVLPLKVKLGLVITLLVIVTVSLVTALLLRDQQQDLTDEMIRRGLTIARTLAASARNPLLANDELALLLLVRDATRDPDVVYIVIADERGRVVAHRDVGLVGKPLVRPGELQPLGEQLRVQSYTHPEHGRVIDFGVPLVFSKVPLGALYLGFSQRTIEQALAHTRRQAMLVATMMVLVGILGAAGLATVLSRPILRLVEGTRAIASGNFRVVLAVPSRDELGILTESFNQMARSLREKEVIRQAFSRYAAPEVAEEILKHPEQLALSGERRVLTVVFCDIRDFTSVAERLAPEEVVQLLNQFYALAIDTTFKHGGTLNKFLGDGVMALFGAPIPHLDHPLRAVRAALAMQAGVAELDERRRRAGLPSVAIGIGVSTGDVVAGTVGAEERMEYTAIGDSVNLAARLQSAAKPGQILISQATYGEVAEHVYVQSLGMLRVKGRKELVEVYEVRGLTHPA